MENNRRIWDAGEIVAIEYLQKHDYEIVETNYTIQGGEIDIIAKKGGKYTFIEVKFRSNTFFWTPEEALTRTKRKSLLFTIKHYCTRKLIALEEVQFDFIAVEKWETWHRVTHYRNITLQ